MSRGPVVVALVGNPNAGKSALFNALTGARQKIAYYPGVTVERKAGRMQLPNGEPVELVDLPGTYALDASSPDEAVTARVIMGEQAGQARPDVLVIVLDASNLEQHLVLVTVSVGLAVLIGVPLGMQAVQRRGFGRRVLALLALVQTIPSIALFGLLIGPLTLLAQASSLLQAAGISGIGWAPAVIALVLYALLPLVAGTVAGLDSVPPGTGFML